MPPLREMRVLLLCISPSRDAGEINAEALSAADWSRLCDLAAWHGIFPLLASRLLATSSQQPAIQLPEVITAGLKTHQGIRLRGSLRLTASLVELMLEFERSGIRVLPWKGLSLGMLLYGSTALRESGDLDFLFQKKDLPAVLRITHDLGYELAGHHTSRSAYLYTLGLQGEFPFLRDQDKAALEFHLQILPARFSRWQNTPADIERASTVCKLAGHEFLMQRPEDMLLSLCAHATKHNWERLKWSCDIAQFLKTYGETMDWKPFLACLRRERKDAVVLLGLSLGAKLFNATLSPIAQEELRQSPGIASLSEAVAAHILSGSADTIEAWHEEAMVALLCPSVWDRFVFKARPIFDLNGDDFYIPAENRMLFFMNYLFRAARLLKKYGLRRLLGKTAVAVRSAR